MKTLSGTGFVNPSQMFQTNMKVKQVGLWFVDT